MNIQPRTQIKASACYDHLNSKLGHILTIAFMVAAISASVGVTSGSEPLPLPAMSFTEVKLNIFADEIRTNRVFLVFTGGTSDRVTVELLKECSLKFTASSQDRKLHVEMRKGSKTQTITGGLRASVEVGGERYMEMTADQVAIDRAPRDLTK